MFLKHLAEMNSSHKKSISKNLTVSLVAVIVIISLAFIGLHYYLISEREKQWLTSEADENIEAIVRTLKVPLWNIDRENIHNICTYYFQNELITLVKLVGVSGEIFFEKEKNVGTEAGNRVKRTQDIYHGSELIGNVQIAMSPKRSRNFISQLLIASVIGLLITVLGLIISTGFLLKKFLRKPMELLGSIVECYARGDYRPSLLDIQYVEFEPLISVFVDMGKKIDSQMAELKSAEESLTMHRDQLEKIVAQRTQELEKTNQTLNREIKEREQTEQALRESEEK